MKKYTLDFNLEIWVRSLDIYADSEDEAIEKLNDMDVEDIISDGYVKDVSITSLDIEKTYDEDEEFEDSANPNVKQDQYYLTFDVENSLKGSSFSDEYIEDWCLSDASLLFDHELTEDEVRRFLRSSVKECSKVFNEYNTGYDSVDGGVEMYFTNIKLYKVDDQLEIPDITKPDKKYDDIKFSFIAKSY